MTTTSEINANDSLIQFMYFSIFEYDHAKFYVISGVCLIMIYIFWLRNTQDNLQQFAQVEYDTIQQYPTYIYIYIMFINIYIYTHMYIQYIYIYMHIHLITCGGTNIVQTCANQTPV